MIESDGGVSRQPAPGAGALREAWLASNPIRAWRRGCGLSAQSAAGYLRVDIDVLAAIEKGVLIPADDALGALGEEMRDPRLRAKFTAWQAQEPGTDGAGSARVWPSDVSPHDVFTSIAAQLTAAGFEHVGGTWRLPYGPGWLQVYETDEHLLAMGAIPRAMAGAALAALAYALRGQS